MNISISRYNPEHDLESRYQLFEVDIKDGMTVLDCLIYIKENIDSTLTFRRSCGSGICGSCAVKVNGRSILACKTKVDTKHHNETIIEPLNNMKVIKDLVVDMESFWSDIYKTQPWISNIFDEKVTKYDIESMKSSYDCIMCGVCYSDCNVKRVDRSYIGSGAIMKCNRLIYDSRDGIGNKRTINLVENGLYKCTTCGTCQDICPQHIKSKDIVEDLRYNYISHNKPLDSHQNIINSVLNNGTSVPENGETSIELCAKKFGKYNKTVVNGIVNEKRGVIKRKFGGVSGRSEYYIKTFEGDPINEVVLFLGCMINLRQQNIGISLVDILQKCRVGVHLLRNQLCCGSPLYRIGHKWSFNTVANTNIKTFNLYAFKGVTNVLTSCSGCNLTLRENYKEVVNKYNSEVEYNVYDVGEYISELNKSGMLNFKREKDVIDEKIGYHYPCHIKASGMEKDIYISLLRDMNVNVVELNDMCCGSGGGVKSAYPDLGEKMSMKRLDNVIENNINGIVTNCPFCYHSFKSIVDKHEKYKDLKVFDFYEIVNSRLDTKDNG